MEIYRLDGMLGGWFVGSFNPTALATDLVEVALKSYSAGATEADHYHQIATEVTLIVSGQVRMLGRDWGAGDIVVLRPGEVTSFEAVTDSTNVVVKVPGVLNDKYLAPISDASITS